MSDGKNNLTAVDACKEIAKALRGELNKLKKTEFSAQDAALKVSKSVVDAIKKHQENFEKMQQLEKGEPLAKKTPSNVSEETMHKLKDQYGHDEAGKDKAYATAWMISKKKKGKKHHKKVQKSSGLPQSSTPSDAEIGMEKKDSDLSSQKAKQKEAHPIDWASANKIKGKGAVLPGDKMPEKLDPKESGSGGQVKKGKLKKGELTVSPVFQARPKVKPAGMGLFPAGTEGKDSTGTATTVFKPKVSSNSPLAKGLPKLGQRDPMSRMMTQHAMGEAHKDFMRQAKLPATQQTVKPLATSTTMMSPGAGGPEVGQVPRHEALSEFMPKGKFDKSSLMKEMENMDKAMGTWHNIRLGTKKDSRKPYGPGHFPSADKKPEGEEKAPVKEKVNEPAQKAEKCVKCGELHPSVKKCGDLKVVEKN